MLTANNMHKQHLIHIFKEYIANNLHRFYYGILIFLLIILSFQSKLGLKTNLLSDRAMELWDGQTSHNRPRKSKQTEYMGNYNDSGFPPHQLIAYYILPTEGCDSLSLITLSL